MASPGRRCSDRDKICERTLILLRHAKSDWSGDEADIARPLAKRGRRLARDAGRWLATNINSIDLAVASGAKSQPCSEHLGHRFSRERLHASREQRIDDRVYAASDDELLAVLRELPDCVATVVLVGHNPGIEDLASRLTGEWAPMPPRLSQ